MHEWYPKVTRLFLALVVATALVLFICISRMFFSDSLLPVGTSVLPWVEAAYSDEGGGGSSTLVINDATDSLDYSFHITTEASHSYASLALLFEGAGEAKPFVDLSKYSSLEFNVRCTPRNVLSFAMYTFDENISNSHDPLSYRMPSAFFSCDDDWRRVKIDLRYMEMPEWWLKTYNIDLSSRGYQLDKVLRFNFGISVQSPTYTPSNVKIVALELRGQDWRYLYTSIFLLLVGWGSFVFWAFRQHERALVRELQKKLQKDRPLVAYQQLSIESQKDKNKSAVLHFMATEYANPQMSLEYVISVLGVNRAKINTILKDEVGLTFSAYLNRLRLTEAARLLSEKQEANVAEIAYSVGYNNVSYFNKLFKAEYGCAPKTFKSLCQKDARGEVSADVLPEDENLR